MTVAKSRLQLKTADVAAATPPIMPPSGLDPNYHPLFIAIAMHLQDAGRYAGIDDELIANYCLIQRDIDKARALIETEGMVSRTSQSMKPHPGFAIISVATSNLTRLGVMLGLGPKARRQLATEAAIANAATVASENPWTE